MSRTRRPAHFGRSKLPDEQQIALRKAIRLEWITIIYMVSCIVAVALVMGSSQAMKAAWIEDMLALVPAIAFLIATHQVRKSPSPQYPYGRHRAVASGHLAASTALLIVGALLLIDSATALLKAEHPPIGTVQVFGHTIWAGWLMIAVMLYTAIGPVLIARKKLPLSEALHDRVLFADADMQKADWMTATGSILGIIGIGFGLWWADAAVAVAIALSIVYDGWSNLHHALAGLMDARARTYDNKHTHPLVSEVQNAIEAQPWVAAARCRIRDVGHLLHVEAHVVPHTDTISAALLQQTAQSIRELDWKLHEVNLVPVATLPDIPDPAAEQD